MWHQLRPPSSIEHLASIGLFTVFFISFLTAESINPQTCRWQDSYNVSAMTSQRTSGYLSSDAMLDAPLSCNRPDRPWTISARPGQRINLTLYNFTPLRSTQPLSSLSDYRTSFDDDIHFGLCINKSQF